MSAIEDEEMDIENKLRDEAAARKLFYRIMKQKLKDKEFKKQSDLKFILKVIWRDIDKTGIGVVSKQEVYDKVSQDENIQIIFEIDSDALYDQLKRLDTKRSGLIDFQEFSQFMKDQVDKASALGPTVVNNFFTENKQRGSVSNDNRTENEANYDPHLRSVAVALRDEAFPMAGPRERNENYCILSPFIIKIMKEDFDEVDQGGDQLVSREQLLYKLRTDRRIIQVLERPAMRVPWARMEGDKVSKVENRIENTKRHFFTIKGG